MGLDLLIKNGTVVDGSGKPRYHGDVGIKSGRIQEIGKISASAQRTIDADGLIVVSDMSTGFWAFRMEGFQGWNGEDWGVPNISSVQDWEKGPVQSR